MIFPVIIIGMHRSGTSMIARMLEEFGLFMGEKKDQNNEALFFIKINNWLLRQSGGAWDHPKSIHYLLKREEIRLLVLKYIRFYMKTPRIISYLGWFNYVKYRSCQKLDFSWGWKDPRNTFTLPVWLDIFPDARVIHVYRNGVDVANSLTNREIDGFKKHSQPVNTYSKILYFFRPKRGGFTDSVRCATLEGSFSLWEEYLVEARKYVSMLKNRAIEVKFEDFLDQPVDKLKTLVSFCGLHPADSLIRDTAKKVEKSRAFAYRENIEMQDFTDKVNLRLNCYGY